MTNKSNSGISSEKDPCWKGYEQVDMKDKDGKQGQNCIPENKSSSKNKS